MKSFEKFHRRIATLGPASRLEKLLFCILVPLSLIYGSLMWVRSFSYRKGLMSTTASGIPVIGVGNLAVGGTGKTPFVDHLLDYFESRGFHPAVVSRGYGGSFSGELAVVSEGSGPLLNADYCGDEPYLLAQKHPQATVMIAPRRRAAINRINAEKIIDVIILDDAFQHLQVARDLDIVLLDAEKPYGNGYPLPAGLLREFPGALRRADLMVLTRTEAAGTKTLASNIPIIKCRHRISTQLLTLGGDKIAMGHLADKRGVAFAGIARPESFFQALAEAGLDLMATCPFPDHVNYDSATLSQLSTFSGYADYFITTEKDAVKIAEVGLSCPCYVAQLDIELHDDEVLKQHLENICDRISDAD